MERLTNANHKEMGFFAYAGPKNPYSVPLTIGELAEGPNIKYIPREILEEVFARLAAYEDTGLEPEEVLDLLSMREITPEAEYAINKHADSLIERMDALIHKDDEELEKYRAIGDLSHLQELAQAEQDGRLVVIPCKVGDAVYEIEPLWIATLGDKDAKCRSCKDFYEGGMGDAPCCLREDRGEGVCLTIREKATTLSMIAYWMEHEQFGKTVFLTRQEAEEALRKEAENG